MTLLLIKVYTLEPATCEFCEKEIEAGDYVSNVDSFLCSGCYILRTMIPLTKIIRMSKSVDITEYLVEMVRTNDKYQ